MLNHFIQEGICLLVDSKHFMSIITLIHLGAGSQKLYSLKTRLAATSNLLIQCIASS